MAKSIYVGNLSYSTTEDELREIFGAHGTVASAKVMNDKFTGRPRGFAFVEMPSDDEAQRAIDALNETEVSGRRIVVNEARPRTEGGGGGDRGGRGGYGSRDNRGGDRGGYSNDRY
ncbi:MAG TPA: RNA-binding protein [Patescibacteria group bacterium]|nr:RNA-binding protein [Patescibacteria group bacterium]